MVVISARLNAYRTRIVCCKKQILHGLNPWLRGKIDYSVLAVEYHSTTFQQAIRAS